MNKTGNYLPGLAARAQWMRIGTASIQKRFFFCERSMVISQSAWLPHIPQVEIKLALPLFAWQDAMMANALRERVFELRYPSRLMEVDLDAPVVDLFDEALYAPSAEAFILSLARVFKPAQLAAYNEYLAEGDPIADGPTLRFMKAAAEEKAEQIAVLTRFAREMLESDPAKIAEAEAWCSALSQRLAHTGGLSLIEPRPVAHQGQIPGRTEYKVPARPARTGSFQHVRFYWPNVLNPGFGYGEGVQLQLRSAISHFNEVWAVEAAGVVLHAFADDLDWEFLYDAARWTYDEARHCRMGYDRLLTWGYRPEELPLGSYIYESGSSEDPVYMLGMLHYFETLNIGQKTKRAEKFASYNDMLSQHDMDFDWADETIHAHYGSKWIAALRAVHPERVPDVETLKARCSALVEAVVKSATEDEYKQIHAIAERIIEKAEQDAQPMMPA